MKYLLLLFFGLLLAIPSAAQDPWASNDINSYDGKSCAYLAPIWDFFEWRGRKIEIHEAEGNDYLPGSRIQVLKAKRYVYLPHPAIERVEVRGNFLRVTLTTITPDLQGMLPRFRKKNEQFTLGNLTPACAMSIVLRAGPREFGFDLTLDGSQLDGHVIDIDMKSTVAAEAMAAYAMSPDGGLSIKVHRNITSVRRAFLNISYETIVNSDAYRKHVAPVEGNLISVDKALKISDTVIESLQANAVIDASLEPEERERFLDFFFAHILKMKEILLSWEELQLQKSASGSLENFSEDQRYRANVITRLKRDVNDLTDDEWCKKYRLTTDNSSLRIRNVDVNGSVKVDIVKVFGGKNKGQYKRDKTDNLTDKSDEDSEDCGKSKVDRSTRFEMGGQIVTPKGIIALEVIAANAKHSSTETITFSFPRTTLTRSGFTKIYYYKYY